MTPDGWLFDAYAVEDGMAVWLIGHDGRPHRLTVPFAPIFYAAGPARVLERVASALAAARIPAETAMAVREELFSGAALPVLQIAVQRPVLFPAAVRVAARIPGVSLFDCDLSVPQVFFAQTGLFPLGRYRVEGAAVRDFQPLDAPTDLEYALPPLRVMRLRLGGDPVAPTHTRRTELEASVEGETVVLCGERPEDLIGSLNRLLACYDPDLILTEWGDGYLIPRLQALAQQAGRPLRWNREAHQCVGTRRARSYTTYGQTVYTAGAQMFFGRWHLDLCNSFIYGEAEVPGLLEIARLSRLPVQYAARTSIGTAISAMQLVRAIQRGILIPWHKREPELFKSAEELLLADKGGLTYQPIVGTFEHVGELDFSSMYPTIMARFNVSPETVNCACCPDAPRVPETGARLCQRRKGLVPEVLEPLLVRRAYYKRRKLETSGAARTLYQHRQTALKWCLVCCLDGATQVLHRINGRWTIAPIRDIVEAYLPGDQWGEQPLERLAVTGIDGELRGCVKPVASVVKTPAPPKMIQMRLRWGRKLLMTPNHRCYVLRRGRLQVKRADQLVPGDWIPLGVSLEGLVAEDVREIDLVRALRDALSPQEQKRWRVFGSPVRRIVQERYRTIAHEARREYAAKTIWNWREYGYLPLSFIEPGDFAATEHARISIGRGRLSGGLIQRIPSRIEVDEDLGFLLGFFVGDGSATRNTIRFNVGANEREHLTRLRAILRRKLVIKGRRYREPRARMEILQVNSTALVQVFKEVFGLEGSAKRGKLRVPEAILNGPQSAKRGFVLGLIASDGNISWKRNFASIVSASQRFVRQLGLLFTSLGIDYRITDQGRLYGIQTKNLGETRKILYEEPPASRKHLRALRYRQSLVRTPRLPQIPVWASGLLTSCQRARVVRVPRISGVEMVSKSVASRKLHQILEKPRACTGRLSRRLAALRQIVESPLIFSPVTSVEEVPYNDRYVYCFRLADEPAAFFAEGGILTGNSFGYLGYRNARFGRIEAHEATTAFSREMLLRAKEVAEAQGYRMLHALVDSLWLHRPGAAKADYEALAATIERATGLPIFVEGLYDWIAFLPSRTHPGLGVPNRYVGRFDDGTSKVRGIEVRRADVPAIVERMQQRMLEVLFEARTLDEVRRQVPRVLEILDETVARVRDGEVRAADLAVTTTISRRPEDYRANALVAVAARQMARAGVRLHPGERIQYIVTEANAAAPDDRVRPLGLLGPDWSYDVEYYVELLVRATGTLLEPFGYPAARLREEVRTRAPESR
jgi:DNA polymerase elongation subunit (family B)